MPASTYESIITRHVSRLLSRAEIAGQTKQLLEQCSLESAFGGQIRKRGGQPLSSEDCYRYKQSVRKVLGEAAYSSAKVNFILGGCDCRDCKPRGLNDR